MFNAEIVVLVYEREPQPLDPPDVDGVAGINVVEQQVVWPSTLLQPEPAFPKEPGSVAKQQVCPQKPDHPDSRSSRTGPEHRSRNPISEDREWDIRMLESGDHPEKRCLATGSLDFVPVSIPNVVCDDLTVI